MSTPRARAPDAPSRRVLSNHCSRSLYPPPSVAQVRTVAALGLEQKQAAKYASSLEAARLAGVIKSTKVPPPPGDPTSL